MQREGREGNNKAVGVYFPVFGIALAEQAHRLAVGGVLELEVLAGS